jgi:nucleotide-binding universal stress UspA family protein
MVDLGAARVPFVESVLHPTDFSEASDTAFAHALVVALIRRTRFALLHVTPGTLETSWKEFPPVRRTLERWGLLEAGSPRSAVFDELGMRVEKVAMRGRDPVRSILQHLERDPAELIVLATEGRAGLPRWLHGSVAEGVARQVPSLTLFVPKGAHGFVDAADGSLALRNVLVPVSDDPPADAAIEVARRVVRSIGDGAVPVHLLHVGDAMPALALPDEPACDFRVASRSGNVVDEIVDAAAECSADLVIMVTKGRDGILDALRGTHTEQVLRRVSCPVLAVPLAWTRAYGART